MNRCLISGLVMLMFTANLEAWGGGALRVCLVHYQPGAGQGLLKIREIYTTQPSVQKAVVTQEIDGKPMLRTVEWRRYNLSESILEVPLEAVTIHDTDNNTIKADALPDLFRQERAAVLCSQGMKMDSAYLKALKKGTLVIVVPFAAYPSAPYPVQAVPAPMSVLPTPKTAPPSKPAAAPPSPDRTPPPP